MTPGTVASVATLLDLPPTGVADILASGGDIMSTFEKQTESEAAFMKRWSPTRGPAAEESKAGPGVPATG